MTPAERVEALDWAGLESALEADGAAVTPPLLTPEECADLRAAWADDLAWRKRIIMQRHGYGQGEYGYFAYPLPLLVQSLRAKLYDRLRPIAERWTGAGYPPEHGAYLDRCRAAGQTRPTPLLLKYGPGDYNRLHQDLYGAEVFPIQAVFLLSQPGEDFDGGELVLTEQRPRMQSRAMVLPLAQGSAAIFAVNRRPVASPRGGFHVQMRHCVSPVRSGERYTLGIILHDAA
jgi:uncharacterized protein